MMMILARSFGDSWWMLASRRMRSFVGFLRRGCKRVFGFSGVELGFWKGWRGLGEDQRESWIQGWNRNWVEIGVGVGIGVEFGFRVLLVLGFVHP